MSSQDSPIDNSDGLVGKPGKVLTSSTEVISQLGDVAGRRCSNVDECYLA